MNNASNKKSYTWMIGISTIVLSALVYILFVYQLIPGRFFWSLSSSWGKIIFVYYLGIIIVNILGLTKSIKETKSSNKKIGFFGVILSILSLLLAIILGLGTELSIFSRTT